MIGPPPPENPDARSALAEHIARELVRSCRVPNTVAADRIREVAEGVAAYLSANRQADVTVNRRQVLTLAARALHAIGDTTLSRRLTVFGSGVVAPAAWTIAGGGPTWILDLRRLLERHDDHLEIVLFRSLNAVLETLADEWNGSAGRGMLGLRQLGAVASSLVARPTRHPRSRRLAREILTRCADRFDRIGAHRDWRETPVVINLDPTP